jgi:hypothetical protein
MSPRRFFSLLLQARKIKIGEMKVLAHLIRGGQLEEDLEPVPMDYDPLEGW